MPASAYTPAARKAAEAAPLRDPEAPWKVFIAYENVQTGQEALRILGSVGRRLEAPELSYPALWRFDLLEDPNWRDSATADALQADLIVISGSSGRELSASVQDWLHACLAQKCGSAAGVLAMFGSADHPEAPDSPRIQFLESAVNEAGLDFFAPSNRR
jgi:hypothetical protein